MEAARSSEAGMVKRSARRGRARWAVGAMGGEGCGGGGGAVERGLHGGAVGVARSGAMAGGRDVRGGGEVEVKAARSSESCMVARSALRGGSGAVGVVRSSAMGGGAPRGSTGRGSMRVEEL